jgi:uncharacterized membrane protein (UPF0127 family)
MGSSGKWIVGGLLIILVGVIIAMQNQATSKSEPTAPIPAVITVGEFTDLVPFTLGQISLLGSVADTDAERARGLSGTTEIPVGIAKVFIFDTSAPWSFWMKDMNYSIDIFWLDASGTVVHLVEEASPDTYPDTSFVPPVPALYVIETKAGFARENNIGVGAVAGMTQVLTGR